MIVMSSSCPEKKHMKSVKRWWLGFLCLLQNTGSNMINVTNFTKHIQSSLLKSRFLGFLIWDYCKETFTNNWSVGTVNQIYILSLLRFTTVLSTLIPTTNEMQRFILAQFNRDEVYSQRTTCRQILFGNILFGFVFSFSY